MKRASSTEGRATLNDDDVGRAIDAACREPVMSREELLHALDDRLLSYSIGVRFSRQRLSAEAQQREKLIKQLTAMKNTLAESATEDVFEDLENHFQLYEPAPGTSPVTSAQLDAFRARLIHFLQGLLSRSANSTARVPRADLPTALFVEVPDEESEGSAFAELVRQLEKVYAAAFGVPAGRTKDGPFVRFAYEIIGAAGVTMANGRRHSKSSIWRSMQGGG